MANRPALPLGLRTGDRDELESWLRSRSLKAGRVKRARIVLMAADGVPNREIATKVGASPTTVIQWRSRYAERGLAGLEDHRRSGRPRELDHAAIVTATLEAPPKKLGARTSPSRPGHLYHPWLVSRGRRRLGKLQRRSHRKARRRIWWNIHHQLPRVPEVQEGVTVRRGKLIDIQTALSAVALPALSQVVSANEVDAVHAEVTDDPGPGSITIRVRLVGEWFEDLLIDARVQPEPTVDEFRERFRSNLVDFIAESRFGWGQNRG